MAEVVLRASIGQGTADSDRVVGSTSFFPGGAAAARWERSLMALLLLLLLEMDRRVRDGAHCRDLEGLLHLYGGEQSMVRSTSFFPGGAAAARWERSLMALLLLLLEMDRRVRDGAHWDLDGLLRQYYLSRDEQSLVGDDQAEDLRFGFDEDGHRDICGVDTSISAAPPGADAALDVDLLSDLLGLDNPSLCASTPGGDGGLDADPGSSLLRVRGGWF